MRRPVRGEGPRLALIPDGGFDLLLDGSSMWVRRCGEHSRANLFVFCWCVFTHVSLFVFPWSPERTAAAQHLISIPNKAALTPLLIFSSFFPPPPCLMLRTLDSNKIYSSFNPGSRYVCP